MSTSNGSPTPHETSLCALPAQSPGNLLVSSSFDAPPTVRTAVSKAPPVPARRDVVQTMEVRYQQLLGVVIPFLKAPGYHLLAVLFATPLGIFETFRQF